MITSLWDDLKREFSYGNMVTRLIIINCAVFVVINLAKIILNGFSGFGNDSPFTDFLHLFCLSSDPWEVLTHPWSIVTNMFLHEGFMHILWNMLFLYWFGRIVADLIGNHRILPLYFLGGLAGGLAYFASVHLIGYGGTGIHYALGASGAVMAIVVASGVLAPDYDLHLLLIGSVKLKYVVLVLLFLDLIGIADNINTGGHFAHLGGAAFGWFFIYRLREGHDMSIFINSIFEQLGNFFSGLFSGSGQKKAKRPRVVFRNKDKMGSQRGEQVSDDPIDVSHQEKLDSILDKIKQKGYESLSTEEKEFLFNASKK